MHSGAVIVRTERLLLRPPAAADAGFALALLSEPRTTTHNPSDALGDMRAAEDQVARWLGHWDAGLGYWIVEHDDDAVGICGVKAVDLEGRPVWNLLYRFLPGAWGHGFAREAATEAVRAAAEMDASRPVVARVRPANTASARVAAAIGLERRPDLDMAGEDGPDEVWATQGA